MEPFPFPPERAPLIDAAPETGRAGGCPVSLAPNSLTPEGAALRRILKEPSPNENGFGTPAARGAVAFVSASPRSRDVH